MQPYLVSFCNLSAPGPALAVVDFAGERLAWIDGPPGQPAWQGMDGLLASPQGWWCLPQLKHGGVSGLALLNHEFEWEFCAPLTTARDAHSLVAWEDGFLVNDTAANRLVHVRPRLAAGDVVERVVWTADSAPDDCVHLNSVAVLADEIYVSMFGPRPAGGWQLACDGQIYNVTRQASVCGGLRHPHSLVASKDDLLWLESGTGWLYAYDVAQGPQRLVCVSGYVRGLAVSDACWLVGASGRRRRSRSTGLQLAHVEHVDESAALWRVDRRTLHAERCSLAAYGVEVYEVLPCDAPRAERLLADGAASAAGQRAERIERELQRLKLELSDAVQDIRRRDQVAALQAGQLHGVREELAAAIHQPANRDFAGRLLEQLLLHEPDDPELLYWHAVCLRSLGQTDRALARFAEALAAGADEFWARFQRGTLLLALGQAHQAVVDLRAAQRLEPNHFETARLLHEATAAATAPAQVEPQGVAPAHAAAESMPATDEGEPDTAPAEGANAPEEEALVLPLANRLASVEQQVQGILHSRRWRMLSYLAQPQRVLRALRKKAA